MSGPLVLVRAEQGPDWERSLKTLSGRLPHGAELEFLNGPPAGPAAATGGDVVLVDAPVLVGPGWLDGLSAACESTTASVSPVIVWGSTVPPPARTPAEPGPRLAGGLPPIRLIRREAIALAGPLDEGFYDRCARLGLAHILAPGVVVTLAAVPAPTVPDDDVPYERPPDARGRARLLAGRQVSELTVTFDGRALAGDMAGTQVQAIALLRALHATGAARLRVVLPPDPSPAARAAMEELGDVAALDGTEVPRGTERTHIVHRPYQVTSADDAIVLRRLGDRVVVTHQDSILYHASAYHPSAEAWRHYRHVTEDTLAGADLVIAISEHGARDLLSNDLVDPSRLHVVAQGTDHLATPRATGDRPAGVGPVGNRPFLLCIGTDLPHKNRAFAFAVLAALRGRGWEGGLVLAGAHVVPGGTAQSEVLGDDAVDLGPISDADRTWLYENATAVIYPTVVEGFGLVPFEAASHGTPTLFAPQASLADLLPGADLLVPWDAVASAERALGVLTDREKAQAQVERVRAAGERMTWQGTADRLIELYEESLRRPSAQAAVAAWRAIEAEKRRHIAEGRYWAMRNEVGPTGFALVGESGALPEDVQRALAALSRREATRRPLFGLLRGIQRLAGRR